jgi:hypothetical protein
MKKLNTKFDGTYNLGSVFISLFTAISTKRYTKPRPYVPINMRKS